jgi:tetratricopeptide (TPR) repeat protein
MLAEQSQPDQAAADFSTALLLVPESNNPWWIDRTGIDSEIVQSEQLFNRVANLRPKDMQLWIARANYCGRRRGWQNAAAATVKVIELDPSDHLAWYHESVLKLQLGDAEGYRGICREMLARFSRSRIPNVVERTAKTCLLLPDAVGDPKLLLKVADQGVTGTEAHGDYRWFALARGMAEYREGRFESAISWLRKSVQPDSEARCLVGLGYVLLAMSQHQSGRLEDARAALNAADKLMQRDPGEARRLGTDWDDWLRFRIVRREAAELVKGAATIRRPNQKGN